MVRSIITLGPVGYTLFPGTNASLITALCLFCLTRYCSISAYGIAAGALLILIIGSLMLYAVGQEFDAPEVVIDEVAGMTIALIGATTIGEYLLAFFIFRLFDITKIGGVALFERLPGLWGIMADDLWAAGITVVILHATTSISYIFGY